MSEPSANPMRRALRAMTHGVYVLSLRHDGHDDYLVVALAMQCSVQPPRIAFALAHGARVLPALRAVGSAAFSVLGVNDVAAVRRYGVPGGVKQLPLTVVHTAEGHPVPPEARYWMRVRTASETSAGDHVLFVADVVDATVAGEASRDASDGAVAASDVPASPPFVPLTLAATGFPYAG